MDKVGYTWGALVELNQKHWAFRAGYFLLPVVSNDNTFDTHIPERGEYIGRAGAALSAALAARQAAPDRLGQPRPMPAATPMRSRCRSTTPNYPDITLTRRRRSNYGFIVNVEQALTDELGMFSRASWNAGQTEIMGWTDVDESLSLGLC